MKLYVKDIMDKFQQLCDEELIEEIRNGTVGCIDVLIERYKGMVRAKAKRLYLFGGENEDLIQEGMIGLFKAIQDYNPEKEASFETFGNLCVLRQMYTAIQASNRQKHSPLNSYVELSEELDIEEGIASDNPENLFIEKEDTKQLLESMELLLSAYEVQVLRLCLSGMDYQQTAKELGKTAKSIDNALQRVRKKLEVFSSTGSGQ